MSTEDEIAPGSRGIYTEDSVNWAGEIELLEDLSDHEWVKYRIRFDSFPLEAPEEQVVSKKRGCEAFVDWRIQWQ